MTTTTKPMSLGGSAFIDTYYDDPRSSSATALKALLHNEPVIDITDVQKQHKDDLEFTLDLTLQHLLAHNAQQRAPWFFVYAVANGRRKEYHIKTLNDKALNALYNLLMDDEGFIKALESTTADKTEEYYDVFDNNIKNVTRLIFIDRERVPFYMKALAQTGKIMTFKDYIKHREAPLRDRLMMAFGDAAKVDAFFDEYINTKLKEERPHAPVKSNVEGALWAWTHKLPIDLTPFQIFTAPLTKEARTLMFGDSCFVYACKQLGMSEEDLDVLRSMQQTREMPRSKLDYIASVLRCTFVVTYFNDDGERLNQRVYTCPFPTRTYELILFKNHYMAKLKVPTTLAAVEKGTTAPPNRDGVDVIKVLRIMFKNNYFTPIELGDVWTYSQLYSYKVAPYSNLSYNVEACTKALRSPTRTHAASGLRPAAVYYADFEASTDGEKHRAYMVCIASASGSDRATFYGVQCAIELLDHLPDHSTVYYHNLGYDITFIMEHLTNVVRNPIIKGSRVMHVEGVYKGKHITFKDSYAIISAPLRQFPSMFNLKCGDKEVFPYDYYNSTTLMPPTPSATAETVMGKTGSITEAMTYFHDPETAQQFKDNVMRIKGCYLGNAASASGSGGDRFDDDRFDLKVYAEYYCMQDVEVLRNGFETFRTSLLEGLNLDAYDYVSISSIANAYMQREVYDLCDCYALAGKPRDFISKCVYGGRCMTRDNLMQRNEYSKSGRYVCDFDGVSLYPSSIKRLWINEGIPKVLTPEMLDASYLLSHYFTEEQVTPTEERFISMFYVRVHINHIGKLRHMPLIVQRESDTIPRSSNTTGIDMYVDAIGLEDLIRYQEADVTVLEGYYMDGNRDYHIRDVIERLFQMRLRYKKEGNPLQTVIKLILNSVYGKTILRPITHKVKVLSCDDAERYILKNYNKIADVTCLDGDKMAIKVIAPILMHYNFCTLGVNILSMSKRIMNEVFCTAEDAGIRILYQDTDSGHFYEDDIALLAQRYEERYGRKLIGTALGQFHSDFAEVVAHQKGISQASKTLAIGKKSYIDELEGVDADGVTHVAYHCRMKGITQEVLTITANKLFPDAVPCVYDAASGLHRKSEERDGVASIWQLYDTLSQGTAITFDLCDASSPQFERRKDFTMHTKASFKRCLCFKQPASASGSGGAGGVTVDDEADMLSNTYCLRH